MLAVVKKMIIFSVFLFSVATLFAQHSSADTFDQREIQKQLVSFLGHQDIQGVKAFLAENGFLEDVRNHLAKTNQLDEAKGFLQTGNFSQLEKLAEGAFSNGQVIAQEKVKVEAVSPTVVRNQMVTYTLLFLGILFLPYKAVKNRLRNVLGFKHRRASRYFEPPRK